MKEYLAPARKGLIVRDPTTMEALPMSGAFKNMNQYWKRRKLDGSVVVIAEPVAEPEPQQVEEPIEEDHDGQL